MPSVQNHKIIQTEIQRFLAPLDFKKKNDTFAIVRNEVISLVNLQRSKSSSENTLSVTINIGVYSQYLAEKLGQPNSTSTIWECHWRQRIGNVLPMPHDKWWEVNDDNAEYIASEMVDALKLYGIPALNKFRSLENLVDSWKNGDAPGLTEAQVASYLAISRSCL